MVKSHLLCLNVQNFFNTYLKDCIFYIWTVSKTQMQLLGRYFISNTHSNMYGVFRRQQDNISIKGSFFIRLIPLGVHLSLSVSYTSKFSMVLQLCFCSDRFKISLKFLESVALFIAQPNICLGSFFVQMMTQIPYLPKWILFFIFYICEDPHLLLCFGHISTNERTDASFRCMMYLLFVNMSTLVSLSRLDISSRKSEIAHRMSVIFQTSSFKNCPYFLLPGCIFTFLNF